MPGPIIVKLGKTVRIRDNNIIQIELPDASTKLFTKRKRTESAESVAESLKTKQKWRLRLCPALICIRAIADWLNLVLIKLILK